MSHPENEFDNILHALRDEHRAIEAPASLEDRLVHQTQARTHASNNTGWLRRPALGFSFALLAIVAAVAWWLLPRTQTKSPHQVQAQLPTPTAIQQTGTTAQSPAAEAPTQQTARSERRPRHASRVGTRAAEAVTADSFIPLPASEGLPEPNQISFVRTSIHTSSLPQYGLDVPAFMPPQTVRAEFLVGEDGLPRAIRFIR